MRNNVLRDIFKKSLASLLSILLVFEPLAANRMLYASMRLALSYAIPSITIASLFKAQEALAAPPAGVVQGQNRGSYELLKLNTQGQFPTIDASQTTITMPTAGAALPKANLGQSRGTAATDAATNQDLSDSAGSFGNDTAHQTVVNGSIGRLGTENSSQGHAYQTVINSRKKRRNYNNAPFLNKSKAVAKAPTSNLNPLFTGCTQTQTTTPVDKLVSIDEKKICTRVVDTLQNCRVSRSYTVSPDAVSGTNVTRINVTTQTATFGNPAMAGGGWFDQNFEGVYTIPDWSQIDSVTVKSAGCDDDCRIQYSPNGIAGPWTTIPGAATNGMDSAGSCPDRKGYTTMTPNINITANVPKVINLGLRLNICVADKGNANVVFEFKSKNSIYQDNGFLDTPSGCWLTQYNNEFCRADSWTCLDSSPINTPSGVVVDINMVKAGGGHAIWSDSRPFENTAFEATAPCKAADATGLCNFNVGPIPCFTDLNGNQQCPTNDGSAEQDSCLKLENDGCVFESETCIDDLTDTATGSCMAFKAIYKCGTQSVNVGGKTAVDSTVVCNATRCMGSDCTPPSTEANGGFGEVTGMLGNLTALGEDGKCDASGCSLFKGKPYQCKSALAGVFDCCGISVPGVGFLQYAMTAYGMYKAALTQGWVMDIGAEVSAAGNTVGTYAMDIATRVGQGISSTVTELTGFSFEAAWTAMTGPASTAALGATEATAVTSLSVQIANFVGSAVGAVSGGALAATEVSTQVLQIIDKAQAFMGQMMTVFMWAAVAYAILSLIFACKPPEFELAAQKQMKACHYVGSFCSNKVGPQCYEAHESWCCYGSMLSRIMQEQIRAQNIAGGWGDPKNPNCGGLNLTDIAAVDWTYPRFNLDEYVATLVLGGVKPKAGEEDEFYSMENLTKVNVGANNGDLSRGTSSPGLNKVQSLAKTLNGQNVNADQTRTNATSTHTSGWPGP